MKNIGFYSMAIVMALGSSAVAADQVLYSSPAQSQIILDGKADKAWDGAQEIKVQVDQLP